MATPRWRTIAARVELPLILFIVLVSVVVVRPYGDFPLNDDENHAIGTWNFVHLHRFVFAIDTTPPLRAQVLWGALWTKLFGESFDVLRASTLFLAALTLILFNRLLLRAGIGPGLRFVATLAFFFNPIFFWAAHTYMTEVPYIFATALAIFLFVRAVERESLLLMIAGCIAVAISWWIRQGIVNIFTPMILLFVYRERLTSRWKLFAGLTVATTLIYGAMWIINPSLLVASPSEFATHYKMWGEETFGVSEMVNLFSWYFFYDIQTLALVFLPLTACALFFLRRFETTRQRLLLAAFVLFSIAGVFNLRDHGVVWPYYGKIHCCEITIGNIFSNFSLGPPTLTDVWTGAHPYPFHLPVAPRLFFALVVAVIAGVVFAMIAVESRRRFTAPRENVLFVFAITSSIIGAAALNVAGQYFDRYAVDAAWPVALVLPLLIDWRKRAVRVTATALLVIVATFSILSVQEYFAWNRARWDAFWQLRNAGVPLKQIDAGAEPYLYFEMSQAKTAIERRKMAFGGGRRDYMLAFAPMEGFRVVATHPFSGWLGLHQGAVLTLKRTR